MISFKWGITYSTSCYFFQRKDTILKQSSLYTGLPVITVPLNLFMDDMSANQSKRWSPLHAIQGQLSGLSVEEKNRGKNVFLLGVADRMNILELVSPICQDIENCKQYVWLFKEIEMLCDLILCIVSIRQDLSWIGLLKCS